MDAVWPASHSTCSAVTPPSIVSSGSAPCFSRHSTRDALVEMHASSSGVTWWSPAAFTSAPWASRNSTMSMRLLLHAASSGVSFVFGFA